MKKNTFSYRLIIIGFILLFGPAWVMGQILTFEFSALSGSEASATSNSNDANLTSSTITRGAGLTASANGGRYNATSWALTSIANAVTGNDYMEFTITPSSGSQYSVSSIYLQMQRSSTGPRAIALRSSVDGYSSNLDQEYAITDGTSTQNFTFTFTQNNSSSAITYRVYMYAEAVGGSGGIGDGAGNDIIVNGATSSTTPTITLSTASLSGFSYIEGSGPSAEQSFTVEGANLSANISLTPPTNYEISTATGASFAATNPISLTQSGGTVSSTTIYTRLKAGLSAGTYNSENITAASTGATSKTVSCSGSVVTSSQIPNTWINEIHYDNVSTDQDEAVEIVIENPSSFDLSKLVVTLYNGAVGSVGVVYDTRTVNLYTEGTTYGNFIVYHYVYPVDGIQNGDPDGLALSYDGTLIQFLSYEGTFTATEGVANGILSTDIGVSESSTTTVGHSLQLSGTGLAYSAFTWQSPATATLGLVNNSQSFYVSTVWDGSTDTDWATASNWTSDLPTSNYNITIPASLSNYPTISATASCHDLEIAAGGSLTISGGVTLTAGGDVVIQSDVTNSGSLIISGTLTSSAITYNRYMVASQWHMLGSPLTGQSLYTEFLADVTNSITNDGTNYNMKNYVEHPEAWSSLYTSGTSGDFALAQGYATMRSASGVVSLIGTPNTSTQTVSLTRGGYGWNLLSNPFTSAIAANTTGDATNNLLSINSSVMDPSFTALYIWDASSYKIINHVSGTPAVTLVQNFLQVGQGFFVRSTDPAAGTFSITPAMQSHQTSIAFKAGEESIWASITLFSETNSDKASTQILYEENMSRGLDVGYDAGLFGSNSFSLYSRLIEDNGVDFALQCLPTDYEELVVPIGLDAKAGDLVSFSAEALNIPEEYVVVLEDRESDVFTNLSEDGTKYTIQLTDDSDGIGRFFVHTVIQSALGLGDLEEKNVFQVFTRPINHQLVIRGKANSNTTARIYSITGKLLVTANLLQATENTIRFNEEAGIYIVQIVDKNGTFTQKFAWVK